MSVKGQNVSRVDVLCESKSLISHRAAYFVEGFILAAFWALLGFFVYLFALALSRGNMEPSFFLLIGLWVVGTSGLTWFVIPRFRRARTRIYTNGFILPKKEGVFAERYVSHDDVESAVEFSEHRLDITLAGHVHSLTRRDYGDCFDVLRNSILKETRE